MTIKTVQGLTVSDYGVIPAKIEVSIQQGIGIHFVGVPDAYAREGLLRIVTALRALGYHFPGRKVVINVIAEWPRDKRTIHWELLEAAVAYALICAIEDREPDGKIRCGQMALSGYVFDKFSALSPEHCKILRESEYLCMCRDSSALI